MAKIFISYDRASKDVVEELVQDLNDFHSTWFDLQLTGGQDWWDTILSEIRTCDIFVAALTPDSLESQACHREMKYADGLQKPLLPVRLSEKVQPEALPSVLARRQIVDYYSRDKQAFRQLLRALRELPEARPLPDPLPDPPPVPMSYLNTLREQIETESKLTPRDQSHLVFELRSHFRDGGRAEEIIDLLQRLKRRRELILNVAREIDELLGDINRRQGGSLSSDEREPLDRRTSPPPVPPSEPVSEVETGRELKLDSIDAECHLVMGRVRDRGEVWVFEFDAKNRFIIKLDTSAATPCIMARTSLRTVKAHALKRLGWTVDFSPAVRQAVAGSVIGLTSGLALAAFLSRGVRDFINKFEAHRTWIVASRKDTLVDAAADLKLALRTVALRKTISVRRQEAEAQA